MILLADISASTWVALGCGLAGPTVLFLVTRLFSRSDQVGLAQIELQKVAVNANVAVIQALQNQVQTLSERNTLLDLRRSEAETDKTRAMVALQHAEAKYSSLLTILEDRKRREEGSPSTPTTPGKEDA